MKQIFLAAALVLAAATPVHAQDPAPGAQAESGATETARPEAFTVPVEKDWPEGAKAFVASLTPRRGKVGIPAAKVILDVPDSFYFLSAEDARKVLEQAWQNPPDKSVLGMLFPAKMSPLHNGVWGVTVSYQEDGYVKDEDADTIDYDGLLTEMKKAAADSNEARLKEGYQRIELIGWATPPKYNAETHKLYWAKELKFGDNETHTLNYDIRALGRKGVLVLSFVADMASLPEIETNLDTVLNMVSFDDGARYEDFDPSIDQVAAYGIGGLIAGKLLAKAGFFAVALAFLKKFAIVLIAGAAGAFAWLRQKFFGGGKSETDVS